MKKTIISLSALAIAVALTTSFTSCSNEDLTVIQQPKAKTYTLSIPATLDNSTRAVTFSNGSTKKGTNPSSDATFKNTEKVYVYNVTKRVMLYGNLNPSDINEEDGKTCILTGEFEGENGIEKGDELKLFYNMNNPSFSEDEDDPIESSFGYNRQKGKMGDVIDGCEATVTVNEDENGVLTTTTASFEPVQSMFRFQFKDENNKKITLYDLTIRSAKNALVTNYYPLKEAGEQNDYDDYTMDVQTGTMVNNFYAMRFDESKSAGDVLKFIGFQSDTTEYVATKSAPKDGFKNGKFYYSKDALKMKRYPLTLPQIEWTAVKEAMKMDSEFIREIRITCPENLRNAEITISDTCYGYCFYAYSDATIHFKNLTVKTFDYCKSGYTRGIFIRSINNVDLDVQGDNNITCEGVNTYAVRGERLTRLRGNGTLTVTTNDPTRCGIYVVSTYVPATNNYEITTELDVTSQLAAEGYTVTRSARQDNADGSYTWTYTVKPKK